MGCGSSRDKPRRRLPPTTHKEPGAAAVAAGPPAPSRLAPLGPPRPTQINIVETAPAIEERAGDTHVWAWEEEADRVRQHKFRVFGQFVSYPPTVSRELERRSRAPSPTTVPLEITYKEFHQDSGMHYTVEFTGPDAGVQSNTKTGYKRPIRRFAL